MSLHTHHANCSVFGSAPLALRGTKAMGSRMQAGARPHTGPFLKGVLP